MDIILYSSHCPKCNVLEKKLEERNLPFTVCDDFDPKLIEDMGYDSLPVLAVGNTLFDFGTANTWLKEMDERE